MRKDTYFYNKETLQFEPVKTSTKTKLMRFLGYCVLVLFGAVAISFALTSYFPSPNEIALKNELNQLQGKFLEINQTVDKMSSKLVNIHETDKNVHRMVFGMEPIDNNIWEGGVGGHKGFDFDNMTFSGEILQETLSKTEKLARQLEIQSNSLKEIEQKALFKEKEFASIPSIKPIRADKLNRQIKYLSGFGYRIHPIYKRRKFHAGLDFSAPKGTKIYATGDGKISRVEYKRTGYGLNIVIDHGFGYSTLYAHMGSVNVKKGQKVKRGQVIGTVGNTGTSTAPHLHYEVVKDGKKVNPIHFVLDGLTNDEYQQLVNASDKMNQSFD